MTETALVRAAYDAFAAEYEAATAASAWVRERLWERLDALVPPGSTVLDATAGTGLDAVHLAGRGVEVIACDLSAGMLARLAARAPGIPTVEADLARLDEAGLEGPFDGVISTFAGLNTADAAGFARAVSRLLRPGGLLFVHVLNRWRLREVLGRIAAGRLSQAARGLASPVEVVTFGGIAVPHRLWTPRGLYRRAFASTFALERVSGQGIVRPVDDRSGRLDELEQRLAGLPIARSLGTFFTLEMRRR